MAKTKEQKYKEAVTRNVKTSARHLGWRSRHRGGVSIPCIDPLLRAKFGIKPYDTQFDEMIKQEILTNLGREE